MMKPLAQQLKHIGDPNLREIARLVIQAARLASIRALSHLQTNGAFPIPSEENSLERIFLQRFTHRQITAGKKKDRPPQFVKDVSGSFKKVVQNPTARARLIGTLPFDKKFEVPALALAEDSIKAVTQRLGDRYFEGKSLPDFIYEGVFPPAPEEEPPPPSSQPPSESPTEYNFLRLHIGQLDCLDETGSVFGWLGEDDIHLGGIVVDDVGNVKKKGAQHVGSFSSGESKNLNMDFASLDITQNPDSWPKTLIATLLLFEMDYGGAADITNLLYDAVRDEVRKQLQAVGAPFGPVGLVVAYAVEQIIHWIVEGLKDDMFPPHTAWVQLSSRYGFPVPLVPISVYVPIYPFPTWADFDAHDGHYQLTYLWVVTK